MGESLNSATRLGVWQEMSLERGSGTRGNALWAVFGGFGYSESNGYSYISSRASNMISFWSWDPYSESSVESELGELWRSQKDQLGQSLQPQPKSGPSSVFV